MSKKKVKPDEETLVTLLLAKDERGFNLLYDNYSPALFGILLKIVRNNQLAEDLLQEAFVKIWNGMHRYDRSKGTLFTFILNIARNLAIDKLRSAEFAQNNKTDGLDDYVGIEVAGHSETSPDHIGIAELVEKLRPEQRFLIDLAYFKGYTQTEISEEYNLPLGTVKTRMRAALTALRKLF